MYMLKLSVAQVSQFYSPYMDIYRGMLAALSSSELNLSTNSRIHLFERLSEQQSSRPEHHGNSWERNWYGNSKTHKVERGKHARIPVRENTLFSPEDTLREPFGQDSRRQSLHSLLRQDSQRHQNTGEGSEVPTMTLS